MVLSPSGALPPFSPILPLFAPHRLPVSPNCTAVLLWVQDGALAVAFQGVGYFHLGLVYFTPLLLRPLAQIFTTLQV